MKMKLIFSGVSVLILGQILTYGYIKVQKQENTIEHLKRDKIQLEGVLAKQELQIKELKESSKKANSIRDSLQSKIDSQREEFKKTQEALNDKIKYFESIDTSTPQGLQELEDAVNSDIKFLLNNFREFRGEQK